MMQAISNDQATGGHVWAFDEKSNCAVCSKCPIRVQGKFSVRDGYLYNDIVLEDTEISYESRTHRCTAKLNLADLASRYSRPEWVGTQKFRLPYFYDREMTRCVAYTCMEAIEDRIYVYGEDLEGKRIQGELFFQEPKTSMWLISGDPKEGEALFGPDDAIGAISDKIHHVIVTPIFNSEYHGRKPRKK